MTEGNAGTVNAMFAVTLGAASTSTVTVDYSTFDGTAVARGDYADNVRDADVQPGADGQADQRAGERRHDRRGERDLHCQPVDPSNATIAGTGIGTGTITNDDTLPTISIGTRR